jgi:hypothetical protein
MHAGIGAASSEAAQGPGGIQGRQGLLQTGLNGGQLALTLPAMEGGAVVLQAEGNTPQAVGATEGQGGAQTSSMIAISALSPRRRTVRTMRV